LPRICGTHPYNLRSPEEFAGYFEGLELLEPGVVPTTQWRPDSDTTLTAAVGYCAIGRKP
jgi:hypothetical protein